MNAESQYQEGKRLLNYELDYSDITNMAAKVTNKSGKM